MSRNWVHKSIGIVFIFGIGWMFGLFVEHINLFHLSFEVSAFSIINLLVLSFLAWYVNYSIQNSIRKRNSKNDLLSDKIDEVDAYLKRILELSIKENGASYIEMCKLDKNCRSWAKRIIEVVESTYKDTCPPNDYITLTQDFLNLREKITTSSIIIEGQPQHVIVENNIATYSLNRQAEINVLIDTIRYTLYRLKVGISQQ